MRLRLGSVDPVTHNCVFLRVQMERYVIKTVTMEVYSAEGATV